VAERSEADLIEMVGRAAGRKLHALSHGRDARVVERRKRRRSMGAQRGFGLGSVRPGEVDAVLVELVERVMLRMRKARRVCRTVVLRMRFGDYTRATRSHTMGQASAETDTILATARDLVQASMPLIRERGLTLVGISLTNLDDGAGQLALPVDGHSVPDLDATVDRVHERFGKEALTRGVLVGRDLGSSIPMLPD